MSRGRQQRTGALLAENRSISLLDEIAERRIAEAQARGLFDRLPGAGRPLALDDSAFVPEHLRAGYRMLKNAGFLPPELELRRELALAAELVRRIQDPERRRSEERRLRLRELRLLEGRTD